MVTEIQPIVPSKYSKGYEKIDDFGDAYEKLQQGKTSEFQLKCMWEHNYAF